MILEKKKKKATATEKLNFNKSSTRRKKHVETECKMYRGMKSRKKLTLYIISTAGISRWKCKK